MVALRPVTLAASLLVISQANAFGTVFNRRSFHTLSSAKDVRTSVSLYRKSNDGEQSRKKRKRKQTGRFAQGDELKNLRKDLSSLRENLKWAEAMGDLDRSHDLRKAILNGENRDPELVYANALKEIEKSEKIIKMDKRLPLLHKWTKTAYEARAAIRRFNLQGLWVGNFGARGYQLINITYAGDTIVATKATGDTNVPRGKVSFEANLAPRLNSTTKASLASMDVSDKSSAKWGITKLERYSGKGQVASSGFETSRFVDGQFIMFDNTFSFLWLPTKHHVLFTRPDPEQTLRMLRDTIALEDEEENVRHYLERCYRMDSMATSEDEGEPFRRIMMEHELVSLEDGGLLPAPSDSGFSFWQVKKWKGYLDGVLRDEKDD